MTPLHLAVLNNREACVELLLKHKAWPSASDILGFTSLQVDCLRVTFSFYLLQLLYLFVVAVALFW